MLHTPARHPVAAVTGFNLDSGHLLNILDGRICGQVAEIALLRGATVLVIIEGRLSILGRIIRGRPDAVPGLSIGYTFFPVSASESMWSEVRPGCLAYILTGPPHSALY